MSPRGHRPRPPRTPHLPRYETARYPHRARDPHAASQLRASCSDPRAEAGVTCDKPVPVDHVPRPMRGGKCLRNVSQLNAQLDFIELGDVVVAVAGISNVRRRPRDSVGAVSQGLRIGTATETGYRLAPVAHSLY